MPTGEPIPPVRQNYQVCREIAHPKVGVRPDGKQPQIGKVRYLADPVLRARAGCGRVQGGVCTEGGGEIGFAKKEARTSLGK